MDITKFINDPEGRKRLIEELRGREAERLAAMSPEERAEYDKAKEEEDAYQDWLAEPVAMTRGDLQMQEYHYGTLLDEVASDRDYIREKADNATASQSGTDRALTKAQNRIKELEAALMVALATIDATDTAGKKLTELKEKIQHFERKDAKRKTSDARAAQGGTDRAYTDAQKRIAELEAEVAELTKKNAELEAKCDELLKRLLAATGAEVVK